ncbi:hypothetical protein BU17DRAFT_81672 [Hysterangium stoloniferum]|nr:hypothetical protein BU17DRAFT_81672 [Hysterangium stoloniferum]
MQPASGPPVLSSRKSPRDHYGDRGTEIYSTRRLGAAIDALRREAETALWEFNSLTTHKSSLEQRLLFQTKELDMMNRSLANLGEQHRMAEQQHREKIQALRSELVAVQEEQRLLSARSNDTPTMSDQEHYQSPSSSAPNYLQPPQSSSALESHTPSRHTPHPSPTTASRGIPRGGGRERRNNTSSRCHAERPRNSLTRARSKPVTSYFDSSPLTSRYRTDSQGGPSARSIHNIAEKTASAARSPRGSSPSPTATLIESDSLGRLKSKKARI